MTIKEAAFFQCAFMILHDQCPPERKHYLCMTEEDDSVQDCIQCWSRYCLSSFEKDMGGLLPFVNV